MTWNLLKLAWAAFGVIICFAYMFGHLSEFDKQLDEVIGVTANFILHVAMAVSFLFDLIRAMIDTGVLDPMFRERRMPKHENPSR